MDCSLSYTYNFHHSNFLLESLQWSLKKALVKKKKKTLNFELFLRRYSSYKAIPTRSPFSSTSSLRSDVSSPDPLTHHTSLHSPSHPVDRLVKSAGCSPSSNAVMATAAALSNGQSHHPATLNGHMAPAQAPPGIYPTGDPVQVMA